MFFILLFIGSFLCLTAGYLVPTQINYAFFAFVTGWFTMTFGVIGTKEIK